MIKNQLKIVAKAGAILRSDTCIPECSNKNERWYFSRQTHSHHSGADEQSSNRLFADIFQECDNCHSLQISAHFRCIEKCRVWIFMLQRITVWVMKKFTDQLQFNWKRNKWKKNPMFSFNSIIKNGPLYLGIIHFSSIAKTTRPIRLWMRNIIQSYGFAFAHWNNKQIKKKVFIHVNER